MARANKEAIVICLDVGPSMNQAPDGDETSLQTSLFAISRILQRKLFSQSKDEIALILFGTPDTDNNLARGDEYQNISVVHPLATPDMEFIQFVLNDIRPSHVSADFVDALVVSMDFLRESLLGKKFSSNRVIIFSDLAGPFSDDQLNVIITGLKSLGTELNFIGPELTDSAGGGRGHGHTGQKQKTRQQLAGEVLMRRLLQQTEGDCYSFSEALPALTFYQTKKVRPTPWHCVMEIGSTLKIPVSGYIKVQSIKKPAWKNIYIKNPQRDYVANKMGEEETTEMRGVRQRDYAANRMGEEEEVQQGDYVADRGDDAGMSRVKPALQKEYTPHKVVSYCLNDEEETEIEKEDIIKGYKYGSDIIPVAEEDEKAMSFKSGERCFKLLGFTKSEKVKRHHYMGSSVRSFVSRPGDCHAAVAMSALINALYETDMVAIMKFIYNRNTRPTIGLLTPHIKAKYECLIWNELPFKEDVRLYTFGSLNVNKKHKPTDEQLSAVDRLITSMNLITEDENEEEQDLLKPKSTLNPIMQRLCQCLQFRAFNPEGPLPPLEDHIKAILEPAQEIVTRCQPHIENMSKLFSLEKVAKKKMESAAGNVWKDNSVDDTNEPPSKKPKTEDDDINMADIAKGQVVKVGTIDPVKDYQYLIGKTDKKDKFIEASNQMEAMIVELVNDSFGSQFYSKALDCLKVLRQECCKWRETSAFNNYLRDLKKTLQNKGRQDFWKEIVTEKVTLIDLREDSDSKVTVEEAKKFLEEGVKKDVELAPKPVDTTDDLLDMLM